MTRFSDAFSRSVLVALAVTFITLSALACGDKNDKPPLMPDQDHSDEAGAPAPPASSPPAK